MREQKILAIIGMHRSGTSLITQWLFRCGLDVGNKLLAANAGNKEGHFEDEEFLQLHEGWLRSRNLTHTGFVTSLPTPLSDDEKLSLATLLTKKKKAKKQWGWKEPRTCLFLSAYHELLPEAYHLVITRSFNDTVNSMVVREHRFQDEAYLKKLATKKNLSWLKWKFFKRKSLNDLFRQHATEYLKVWLYYNEKVLESLANTVAERFVIVNYNDLLHSDRKVFNHLTNSWGFTLDFVPFTDVFKRELLSKTFNVSRFVKDKKLLAKAARLEAALAALAERQTI